MKIVCDPWLLKDHSSPVLADYAITFPWYTTTFSWDIQTGLPCPHSFRVNFGKSNEYTCTQINGVFSILSFCSFVHFTIFNLVVNWFPICWMLSDKIKLVLLGVLWYTRYVDRCGVSLTYWLLWLTFQEEEDDLQMLVVAIQEQLRKANFEDFSNMMDSCRHEDVLG